MKKMKRLFAVLLAMAMVLGMGVTAFAAEGDETSNAKIVVEGVPEGATVTYEKIADAAPTDPVGWSPVKKDGNDLIPEDTLNAWATDEKYQADRGNGNAAGGTIATNADVVTAIKDIALTKTDAAIANGNATINGVTPGLYVIEVQKTGYTFSRMMAYVGYNETDMSVIAETKVTAKGEEDQVKKEIVKVTATADDADVDTSVAEGDNVKFKVTQKYPYLDQNIENPKFIITDTVKGGTIDKDSIVVRIGTELTAENVEATKATVGTDYTLSPDTVTNTFTVTFNYDRTKAGQDVEITYDVKVANDSSLENKVESTISNYNGGDTKTESEIIIPKVDATVKKVDDKDTTKVLKDAEFTLYVETKDEREATHSVVVENEKNVIKEGVVQNAILLKPVKTGEGDAAQVVTATTGENGIATFTNLDVQKAYWIAETKAPTGYSLSTVAVKLTGAALEPNPTVSGTTTTYVKQSDFTQIEFTDTKLNALPSTGGIGTTIFTIGGCAIMIAAAGLFFVSRRKSAK